MTRIDADLAEAFAAAGIDLGALFAAEHLTSSLGMRIESAAPEQVVATVAMEGPLWADGLSRRGGCAILAETVGSIGAILLAGPHRLAVGVDLNLTHYQELPTGLATAVAVPSWLGEDRTSYRVTVTGPRGELACEARLTCAIRARATSR
jgi:uncharacterized protein (TIGR00369 family)